MDRNEWMDQFVAALLVLQSGGRKEQISHMASELWPRFGHLDPEKIAGAAHAAWLKQPNPDKF